MRIKFSNGYTVTIDDSDAKSMTKRQIVDCAKKAVREVSKMKFNDATLGRQAPSASTGISFMSTKMKEAFTNGDMDRVDKEVDFLIRDLKADASDSHKRYREQFRPEIIDALLKQYQEAVNLLVKNNHPKAAEASELLHAVKGVFGRGPELYIVENKDSGEKKEFTDLEKAKAFANDLRERNIPATIVNSYSGMIEDKCGVKDIPYYDPDDAPRILGSNYSTERLQKEIRYKATEEEGADIRELNDVYDEIDDFIKQGYKGLVDSGFTKEDGRRVIASRYGTILTELRNNKLTEEARTLRKKISELEKAWHLDTIRR